MVKRAHRAGMLMPLRLKLDELTMGRKSQKSELEAPNELNQFPKWVAKSEAFSLRTISQVTTGSGTSGYFSKASPAVLRMGSPALASRKTSTLMNSSPQ